VDNAAEDVETTAAADTATMAAVPSARRRSPAASTPPSSGARVSGTGDRMQSTASTPREAMHDDEIARTRAFAKMTLLVMVPMVVGLIIGGGDPLAKSICIGGLATMAVCVAWLIWVTRNPARYTQRLVSVAAFSGFIAVLTGIHYWGVLSPAAAVLLFAIYFFSLGESRAMVYTLYTVGAGGHAVLAVLVMTGAIPELGVITSTDIVLRDQIVSHLVIQLLYVAALRFGRRSRRVTIDAVERLEQAVRALSVREALLAEARQELDRQLKIGGPGRYTEQVVGSFRLGNLLGRGGMGEVYEAVNVHDQRAAAVKLLHASSLGDDAALGRFMREAAVAAKLHSPHVAAVLEVGTTAGEMPFIAMERLTGEDLARQLRKVRRLPPPDVIALVRQVAAALNVAHAAGVVHRDLKPSNLFLADGGTPTWKVLDFGVSKVLGHGGTLTAGRVVGTPGYMAPEQARGEDVDKRADTFSLAAIAYRCLTGHPPFTGKDVPSTLYEVASKMPTQPSQLHDDLPRDVDRVLAIGLAKDPRHRFPDATAFADALVAAFGERLPEDLRRMGEMRIAVHPWGQRVAG
jgi:eukaryotic-like serine/threonine-protein kinase